MASWPGYLYIVDETGGEIEGSRHYLNRIRTQEQFADLRRSLDRKIGDGCMVLDSEVDRRNGTR